MRPIRYAVILAVLMLAVVAGTTWGQDGPEQLFAPASAPADSPANQVESGRPRRFVTVDTTLLAPVEGEASSTLQLALFDGVQHAAVAEGINSQPAGNVVWEGHIQGQNDSSVTLTTREGVAAGSIQADGRLYRLTYAGDGVHLLEEVGLEEPMAEHLPIPITALLPEGQESGQSVDADNGSVIDVLVVYTPASRARYGGKAGIESLIDLAVAETNTAYTRSQINTQLLLVGTAEVSYSESGSMVDDLYRLRNQGDGDMDQVHSWRNTYAADTVTLIQEATDFCGIAFLMSSLSSGFESYAFSVVDSDCATGYYSFGHELGHNMGSTHDHANGNSSLYPYSFGYWAPDYSFRTIMAYNCPGGCPRIQQFSNPNVTYNGKQTGVAYANNPSTAADNARSINEARYTVANWRNSADRQLDAPTSLVAIAQSPTRIDLSWQDTTTDETGFELQRRKPGQLWAIIANLGANTTGYQDNGLAVDTTYEYRVRSYSQSTNSTYSNVASTQTLRYPELHIGNLNGGGSVESGLATGNIVWRAIVTIGVHDAYHAPAGGATVSGQWNGGASGSASCVTDASGYCSVVKTGLDTATGSVTLNVTGISNGVDPYLPEHNHDPDGSPTAITLFKPTGATFLPHISRD